MTIGSDFKALKALELADGHLFYTSHSKSFQFPLAFL
jgi:hypothetical protein